LSGLQKIEQGAKKCIELRGEYVELIPSLVAVTYFVLGRPKDLTEPPLMYGVQVFGKPTAVYYFVIQTSSRGSNLANHIVTFTVT